MEYRKFFFDVGTFDGGNSINFAASNPDYLVYAFEPVAESIALLKEKTSHLQNYIIIPKAVSDFDGIADFNISNEFGCSSLLEFSEKSQTEWPGRKDFVTIRKDSVQVTRLDRFIKENNITSIDHLHVDTQGCDLKVLQGLGDKLHMVKWGMIEAANKEDILYNNQNGKDECIEFLQQNGFEIENVFPNDEYHNEINICFKKKFKIKQYIVTYKNKYRLEKCLNSLFDSLDETQRSFLEVYVVNNHTDFDLNPDLASKVTVLHNTLRPDFSTGHLARSWNQCIINGFKSILSPDCDILITNQDDVEFEQDYINKLIEYHKTYNLIQVGKGDSLMSYTIESIENIGIFDERFCTITFQEFDYYIRAMVHNYDKTSINDYYHNMLVNPIPDLKILKETQSGFERGEEYHVESDIYRHVCSHLFEKKWSHFWYTIFVNQDLRFKTEPLITSFVYYPYFERYVLTLKKQKYVLQNDRIC
jgi:FkbM family methyltransferase